MTRPIRLASAAAALLACGGCSLIPGLSLLTPQETPELPAVVEAQALLANAPPGDPTIVQVFRRDEEISVSLVRVKDRVEPHLHERSTETIYVLEGHGDLLLDRDWRPLTAGMLIHIPRNTPHAYVNKAEGGTLVLSMFTPPYVEGDRVPLRTEP